MNISNDHIRGSTLRHDISVIWRVRYESFKNLLSMTFFDQNTLVLK